MRLSFGVSGNCENLAGKFSEFAFFLLKDSYYGYKKWKGKGEAWTSEISLLGGIARIGLVILYYFLDYSTR